METVIAIKPDSINEGKRFLKKKNTLVLNGFSNGQLKSIIFTIEKLSLIYREVTKIIKKMDKMIKKSIVDNFLIVPFEFRANQCITNNELLYNYRNIIINIHARVSPYYVNKYYYADN